MILDEVISDEIFLVLNNAYTFQKCTHYLDVSYYNNNAANLQIFIGHCNFYLKSGNLNKIT